MSHGPHVGYSTEDFSFSRKDSHGPVPVSQEDQAFSPPSDPDNYYSGYLFSEATQGYETSVAFVAQEMVTDAVCSSLFLSPFLLNWQGAVRQSKWDDELRALAQQNIDGWEKLRWAIALKANCPEELRQKLAIIKVVLLKRHELMENLILKGLLENIELLGRANSTASKQWEETLQILYDAKFQPEINDTNEEPAVYYEKRAAMTRMQISAMQRVVDFHWAPYAGRFRGRLLLCVIP